MALSSPSTWWLVSYDLPAVERAGRARLGVLLGARGRRVLYSVFEVAASEAEMAALWPLLERISADGAVLAIPWCARCRWWRYGEPIERWDGQAVILG